MPSFELPSPPVSYAGKLLVAPAAMIDANFVDAVTLVLVHNDEGAFGLVLDRRIDGEVTLVGQWETLFDGFLWEGGPCEQDRLIPLVRCARGHNPENFQLLTDQLGGLGVVDVREAVDATDFVAMRLFVGYAGWGPGQLDTEVAIGAWVVTEAEFDDPFAIDSESMRGRVLRRVHARSTNAPSSQFPDDVTAN